MPEACDVCFQAAYLQQRLAGQARPPLRTLSTIARLLMRLLGTPRFATAQPPADRVALEAV